MEKCPCGRDKAYNECCGRVHQHLSNAETAEDLMRSRYVAFTQANVDFLYESHHTNDRDRIDQPMLEEWAKSVQWDRLEVLRTKNGGAEDDEGIVEFKAFYKQGRKTNVIHERSQFLKEYGNWVYYKKL